MTAIINYKAGNAPSVMHAVRHIGLTAEFAQSANDLANATHIILPGVGSARATMESLCEMGLLAALENAVLERKVKFLGICVGMQILFEHSQEEDTDCLGWLGGKVVKFDPTRRRVPQMGWNHVTFTDDTPDSHFYFVNSYHAVLNDAGDLWGKSDYNGEFTAAVQRGNIYGTQFHAEKSGEAGLALLRGFLSC